MNLKKSSPDAFSSMFKSSCKKSSFISIITFAFFFIYTICNYISETRFRSYQEENVTGFFWNIISDINVFVFEIFLALAGVIAGYILFSFVLSKKHSNVVFSLGLSRKKIFLANYLAGILPFYAALILAAFLEILSSFCCGYAPTWALVELALYEVLSMIGTYTLAFTVTSAVIAFSGNIIESAIFTVIIGIAPNVAEQFFKKMQEIFTLGASGIYYCKWNFFNPFSYLLDFLSNSDLFYDCSIYSYFIKNSDGSVFYKLTLTDFSGAIMDFVYSGIIFTIAYLMFSKRRNEISGTFGKAKGLNEICGVLVGVYAATVCIKYLWAIDTYLHGNGNVGTYLIMLLCFAVAYFIFRMIFGYKRKLELKRMLKTIPVYAVVLAVVTAVFSTGLLGYSSLIPNADDVSYIEYSADIANPYSVANNYDGLHRYAYYGYAPMTKYIYTNNNSGSASGYVSFTTTDETEINKLIEIHKSFVRSGKIKNSASTACGVNFEITYTLKDGSKIKRFYTETTEENAKSILSLSDFSGPKKMAQRYFYYDYDEVEETTLDNVSNYFYLYTKDLTKCHRCAAIDEELRKAVLADIENQSSNDTFFHQPEDELGVISFGISWEQYNNRLYDSYDYTSSGVVVNDTNDSSEYLDSDEILWNLGEDPDLSVSLSSDNTKFIVLTKDMTNTIKYLTDKGYMKYLQSDITANDVKKIKLATKSESMNRNNSDMLPFFAAGYSNASEVKDFDEITGTGTVYYVDTQHYFDQNVNNEITNKSTIQKVLDSSFLYGYCGNDYRVVEVTFNDGSIATYCISGDVYASLMK